MSEAKSPESSRSLLLGSSTIKVQSRAHPIDILLKRQHHFLVAIIILTSTFFVLIRCFMSLNHYAMPSTSTERALLCHVPGLHATFETPFLLSECLSMDWYWLGHQEACKAATGVSVQYVSKSTCKAATGIKARLV